MIYVIAAKLEERIEELERMNAQLLSENMQMAALLNELADDIGEEYTYLEEREGSQDG